MSRLVLKMTITVPRTPWLTHFDPKRTAFSRIRNKLQSIACSWRKLRTSEYKPQSQQPTSEDDFDPIQHVTWHSATIEVLYGILMSSRVNLLLVFVPVGLACYFVDAGPLATFVLNSMAIIPLSSLLTDSTERIAAHSGDTLGALLNITLGNLVELILL
jgi:Ca2+:H+ antiporter